MVGDLFKHFSNNREPFKIGEGMTGFLTDIRYINKALEASDISAVYHNKTLLGNEVLSVQTGGLGHYPNYTSLEELTIENIGLYESSLVDLPTVRQNEIYKDVRSTEILTFNVDDYLSAARRDHTPLYVQTGNTLLEKTEFVNTIDGSLNPVNFAITNFVTNPHNI